MDVWEEIKEVARSVDRCRVSQSQDGKIDKMKGGGSMKSSSRFGRSSLVDSKTFQILLDANSKAHSDRIGSDDLASNL